MLKYLVISILLMTSSITHAQYGYFGKRNIIMVDALLTPAVKHLNYSGKRGINVWNNDYGVRLERVMNRKDIYEIGIGMGRSTYDLNDFDNEVFRIYDDHVKDFNVMTYYKLDLGYTKFNKKESTIAPLGGYRTHRVTLVNNYIGERFEGQEEYYFHSNKAMVLSVLWGRKKIYFDKLIFDYSVGAGMGFLIAGGDSKYDLHNKGSMERLDCKYRFQFRMALGLLP